MYLRQNQLTELSEGFGQLVALQTLDLCQNQLTQSSERFGQRVALQTLDLY